MHIELTPEERDGVGRDHARRTRPCRPGETARASSLRLADGASYARDRSRLGEKFAHDRQVEAAVSRGTRSPALAGRYREEHADRADTGLGSAHLGLDQKRRPMRTVEYADVAAALKLSSHTFVQRAWKRAGLQPHRIERYMRSTDPDV